MNCVDDQKEELPKKRPYAELSRRDLRSLAFHLLYAVDAFDYQESLPAVIDKFNRGFDLDIPFNGEMIAMTQGVIDDRDALDELMKPFLFNWRLERVGLSTKLILRLALWELRKKEIVSNIIMNEAIELAKCFAEKDAYKFINGILDEAIKSSADLQGADETAQ